MFNHNSGITISRDASQGTEIDRTTSSGATDRARENAQENQKHVVSSIVC